MNIIEELYFFNKDELFFKKYYFLDKTKQNIEYFYKENQNDATNLNIALHPESLPIYHYEDDFIKKNHNISIIKHPRYIPYFEHKHAYFEILYVLDGQCDNTIFDTELLLKKGDFCLIAPHISHGVKNFDDNSIVINILVRESTFLDTFMNYIKDKDLLSIFFINHLFSKTKTKYLIFHTHGDSQILNYVLQMYEEHKQMDIYSDRIICSMFSILMSLLNRNYNKDITISQNNIIKNLPDFQIIDYLLKNYKHASLENISKEFHYTVPYCSKLIKETTGYSFSELLTKIRMQNGKNLLLNTRFSIEAISLNLGYKNPETFIRVFKKNYLITPHQFRKQANL